MTASETRREINRLARPLRLRGQLAVLLAIVGSVAFLMGIAAWLVRAGLLPPMGILLTWLLLLVMPVSLSWLGAATLRRLSAVELARRLEERGSWRHGGLTSLLGVSAAGTSEGLFEAADRSQARTLAEQGEAAVVSLRKSLNRQMAAGGVVLSAGALVLFTAGPLSGPARAVWQPLLAWRAVTAPVSISVADEIVNRGDSTTFSVQAIGRTTATLWTRAPGESWRPSKVGLDGDGRALIPTGALATDLFARVTAGRRRSDTVHVAVRLPAFLGQLLATARYPSYLEIEDEPLPVTGDSLYLPQGTRIELQGLATTELAGAELIAGADTTDLAVNGSSFNGTLVPGASGTFVLMLHTASGAPMAGDTVSLPITVIPDRAPVVTLPVPGADTVAPTSLILPLVADVEDDYAVTAVRWRARRISSIGMVDTLNPVRFEIGDQRERLILPTRMDLNGYGLLPGDTVRYFVEAVDNAPRANVGRSPEYVVRLPTLSEMRAASRDASDAVAARLDSLSRRSRELGRETEDLAREQSRNQSSGDGESLGFEEAQRAERTAAEQEALLAEAEALRDALQQLEDGAAQAGLADSEWRSQLEEIGRQLERAMTPEMRESLNQLRQALEDLDAERTQEALDRLNEAQEELREALERAQELFRRAAIEGDMDNLAAEARDLAQQQDRWNDQAGQADSAAAAAQQAQLQQRADSLAAALGELAHELSAEERQAMLEAMAQQAQQASEQMLAAMQAMQQGDRQGAQQAGQQASQQLQPLGNQLDQERQALQQQWREEIIQELDRAMNETSRLVERQAEVQRQALSGTPESRLRAEQGALEEGVQRLMSRMQEMSGRNALVPPSVAEALSLAQLQMEQSREAISTASGNTREAAERAGQAVDALNAAAYQMLRARQSVSGSGSGSGMAEAMEQMAQMAQQQGQLSQQTGAMLPMVGSSGMQQELQRLSEEQRRLAEELERMQAQGQPPQAGPMAEEARELARELESGRLNQEVVRRQERLFRRMLDAGRTLQGQEEDDQKERQSEAPEDVDVRLPPELQSLVGDGDRLRMPSWEELQRFSPEERRLVIDYFRRLAQGGPQ